MIAQRTSTQAHVRDYIALMKPRIIVLLLFTALGGMFLAAEGTPVVTLTIAVLGAGALASGGANALNQWLERDLDGQMSRTRNRPLVSGRVSPSQALIFGTALNGVAFFLLSTYVNTLSAVLTLSATLFYILVYTMGLKRTTPSLRWLAGPQSPEPWSFLRCTCSLSYFSGRLHTSGLCRYC